MAIVQHQMALELDPHSAAGHHLFAPLLRRAQCVEEAMEQCKEAIRLNGKFAKAHQTLGLLLGNEGSTEEAIKHLRIAVAIDPR